MSELQKIRDPKTLPPALSALLEEMDRADGLALVGALLYEARALALKGIRAQRVDVPGGDRQITWSCRECRRAVVGSAPINHRAGCLVGAVLNTVDDLSGLPIDVKSMTPTKGDSASKGACACGGGCAHSSNSEGPVTGGGSQ